MFTTFIVQPIFNLLVLITALIPSHNLGLAIIIFTIFIRILMWPLVKKQLHHTKALRALQPELKKIKAAAAGDRRKEQALTMELYRERQINPFASIGVVLLQLPVLFGLYFALKRIIDDPQSIVTFSYEAISNLSWVQSISQDIHRFDETLFGIIDLTKAAVGDSGLYLPALILVAATAIAQFYQTKQLLPQTEDSRSLRLILKDAGQGKSADQQEVSAAVGRSTMYIIPVVIFFVSLSLPAGLPLYWLTSSLVALWQQSRILKEDVAEAEVIAKQPEKSTETKTGTKRTSVHRRKKSARKRKRR